MVRAVGDDREQEISWTVYGDQGQDWLAARYGGRLIQRNGHGWYTADIVGQPVPLPVGTVELVRRSDPRCPGSLPVWWRQIDLVGDEDSPEEGDGLPEPICWPRFWANDHTAANWHVEPFLARGRAHAVYAPAKAGKSLFVLDVVTAVATGAATLWRPVSPPEHVVYLDYEMTESDLQERLENMGYDENTDLSHLHYYQLPTLPPLDTKEGGETVRRLVERDQAGIVVVDTTGRAVQGDENDADTIRDYYRHTGMALKAVGVTAVRVDHAGKDLTLGQRGSSAKADDVDIVWQLTAAQDGIMMRATHRRLSWVPEQIGYQRHDDPLIHVPAVKMWHARTKEIADLLDRLEVPVAASTRQARTMLKTAGEKADSTPLRDALRFRRDLGGVA